MGTPVLTVPASKPPNKTSSNVCHRLCCQVHWSRRCHRRCRRVRSWNWLRLWLPHHRIRQEPLPEAAAVLLRHSWLCSLRGHGTLLSYDGFPPFVQLQDHVRNLQECLQQKRSSAGRTPWHVKFVSLFSLMCENLIFHHNFSITINPG